MTKELDDALILRYIRGEATQNEQAKVEKTVAEDEDCLRRVHAFILLRDQFEAMWNTITVAHIAEIWGNLPVLNGKNLWEKLRVYLDPMGRVIADWIIHSGDKWYLVLKGQYKEPSYTDFEMREQIGDWALDPEWALGCEKELVMGQSGNLPVSICLPGNIALVHLCVSPRYNAAKQEEVWHIECRLDVSSTIHAILIGLGTEQCMVTGNLDLRRGNAVDFPLLEPPSKACYWVYFEWQDTDGVWHKYKSKFPLLSKMGDESL